ncbi:MAG: FkbM family methyltransferase [Acidobacteria bacterium]|nr:FkbM family methyltransferase [Acidobacteriota bacterium]
MMKAVREPFWAKLRWKLCLPEYLHRPVQILRRLRRELNPPQQHETVRLPWGLELRIRLPELMSNSLWYKGIYDITCSETIWRLLDEGESALDVGANIGYMTSLMAARVGAGGKVMAFEPHAGLFAELEHNCKSWSGVGGVRTVEVKNVALSDRQGIAQLQVPSGWELNRGVASVVSSNRVDGVTQLQTVNLEQLDHLLPGDAQVGLAKLDVEGHEAAVLRGAENLLQRRAIRDIVFEDIEGYPSAAMKLLESHGYSLFSLAKSFYAPRLCGVDRAGVSVRNDPNYLATLNPDRAVQRILKKGWNVLKEV